MSKGAVFVGEIIGTAVLILFGAGVVAAVVLRHSPGGDRLQRGLLTRTRACRGRRLPKPPTKGTS